MRKLVWSRISGSSKGHPHGVPEGLLFLRPRGMMRFIIAPRLITPFSNRRSAPPHFSPLLSLHVRQKRTRVFLLERDRGIGWGLVSFISVDTVNNISEEVRFSKKYFYPHREWRKEKNKEMETVREISNHRLNFRSNRSKWLLNWKLEFI